MKLTLMILTVIVTMISIITLMIMVISKKTITDLQKSTPFECGFNPMAMKRLPFSIHFFLIAIIFLIFDIEIIIIVPMTMTLKSSMMSTWVMTTTMFISILIMGLYNEWLNGMLEWTK